MRTFTSLLGWNFGICCNQLMGFDLDGSEDHPDLNFTIVWTELMRPWSQAQRSQPIRQSNGKASRSMISRGPPAGRGPMDVSDRTAMTWMSVMVARHKTSFDAHHENKKKLHQVPHNRTHALEILCAPLLGTSHITSSIELIFEPDFKHIM